MMQLILTVLAIGLAALLAVGGINYFSTDIGVKMEVSQALKAQFDAIVGAVSSYRMANNGFVTGEIERLNGFLPGGKIPPFPHNEQGIEWTIRKDPVDGKVGLCLSWPSTPRSKGVIEGLIAFAKGQRELAAQYGIDCVDAATTGPAIDDNTDYSFISAPSGAAIFYKGV